MSKNKYEMMVTFVVRFDAKADNMSDAGYVAQVIYDDVVSHLRTAEHLNHRDVEDVEDWRAVDVTYASVDEFVVDRAEPSRHSRNTYNTGHLACIGTTAQMMSYNGGLVITPESPMYERARHFSTSDHHSDGPFRLPTLPIRVSRHLAQSAVRESRSNNSVENTVRPLIEQALVNHLEAMYDEGLDVTIDDGSIG